MFEKNRKSKGPLARNVYASTIGNNVWLSPEFFPDSEFIWSTGKIFDGNDLKLIEKALHMRKFSYVSSDQKDYLKSNFF